MNCLYLEERLEALTQGKLPANQRSACQKHLGTCSSCQELLELAMLGSEACGEPPQSPPDLLPAVLRDTHTDACGRALWLLSSRAEPPMHPTDKELVASHLSSCSECRNLEGVLAKLEQDLPRMALLRPDRNFTEDVLRRTLPLPTRLRRWWEITWPGLVKRPRFASEAAYVGVLILVVVFATPSSPLQAIPEHTLTIIKDQSFAKLELPTVDLRSRLKETTETLRDSNSARTIVRWQAAAAGIAERATIIAGETETQFGTLWHRAASLLTGSDEDLSSPTKTNI